MRRFRFDWDSDNCGDNNGHCECNPPWAAYRIKA